jgi:CheY-like chemotaxis protein
MVRILLVEDNEDNRDMLARRLERKQFEVIMAENGQVALDKARRETPDVILMDMSMPVMDGWEATRILKSEDGTKTIPIIGLSAHAMQSDRDKAMEIGCNEYEVKPIVLDSLLDKIAALTK